VEGEERASEKEVIEWMEIDIAKRADDEHQEEEKEEGDGGEVANLSGEGAGLKFFRHSYSDLKSG
jgi:hypothetical protein